MLYKISFYTTCMNRLNHVSQTFLTNIKNSQSYLNREFILLNYRDNSGLDEWVKHNLMNEIEHKLVVYGNVLDPIEFWNSPHAKNLAAKLATGDILVNMDADNYILPGYCEFINEVFQEEAVINNERADENGNMGSAGKIAVLKKHFYKINGYNEKYSLGWSWDDTDLYYRIILQFPGIKSVCAPQEFNLVIGHDNDIRTENSRITDPIFTFDYGKSVFNEMLKYKKYIANPLGWGKATILKNFIETISYN